jgi:hypothetical protein
MKGPVPECGAIPVGKFYRVLVKAIGSIPFLVTMTLFLFPALMRAWKKTGCIETERDAV